MTDRELLKLITDVEWAEEYEQSPAKFSLAFDPAIETYRTAAPQLAAALKEKMAFCNGRYWVEVQECKYCDDAPHDGPCDPTLQRRWY